MRRYFSETTWLELTHSFYNLWKRVPWTKVDQSDFYSLCAIDPELAEQVKRIAAKEGKPFRDVLRSAVNQMKFGRKSGLKKFWESLTPEERSEHTRKASEKRWGAKLEAPGDDSKDDE